MCWGTSFTLSQAVYDSALAFTSCLCRAWRSARSESLGPSQVFSKYAPCPGHLHGFLDSQEFVEALQNDYPKHLISSFLPKLFNLSPVCPRLLEFPTPPFFLTTLKFQKLWFSLLFILQRGNTGSKRGSDFSRTSWHRDAWVLDQYSFHFRTRWALTVAKAPGSSWTPVLAKESFPRSNGWA